MNENSLEEYKYELSTKIEESNRVKELFQHKGWEIMQREYEALKKLAFLKMTNENVVGDCLEKARARYNDLVIFCKVHEAVLHEGKLAREELEKIEKGDNANYRTGKKPNLYNSNIGE